MTFKRISFFGLPIDVDGDMDAVCDLMRGKKSARLVSFVGPGAWWALAKKDPEYAECLEQMTLVLPEGWGMSFACRLLAHEDCRPGGFDILPFARTFFEKAVKDKLSLGLVGGRPGIDEDIHAKLQLRYPGLVFAQTMHGFGDFPAKIKTLMSKPPDIVIVGMESPRQEAFLVALREAGFKGFAIADRDFFDHFDHYPDVTVKDPCPAWINEKNMRFLYRLYTEPRRLWRHYLVDYPFFLAMAAKTLWGEFNEKRRKTV